MLLNELEDELVVAMTPKRQLQLCANQFCVLFSAEGLRPLDGSPDSTVNDELGKDTQGTGNAEENSVIAGFSQAIILKEDTRVLQKYHISK